MYLLNQNSIETLNGILKLPSDGQEQDWEHELADAFRIREFIDAYATISFSADEKRACFALIISSLDNAISEGISIVRYEEDLRNILSSDTLLLSDIVRYWNQPSPAGDTFPVSYFLAKLT